MATKDFAAWRAQLRKGAAELAVLALLGRNESYGARILEDVGGGGGLDLSEGSIYPLLLRMQEEGTIASRWVEDSGTSHPRKYYRLTPAGEDALEQMVGDWEAFAEAMEEILDESTA